MRLCEYGTLEIRLPEIRQPGDGYKKGQVIFKLKQHKWDVATMYTLEREQFVTSSLEHTWNFLENPANLNTITPEDLHFSIISPIPEAMYDGLIIEYRISIPLFGLQKWIAEIKHIRERQSFVDEQRVGPYNFWYHYHELVETMRGVRVIDRVHYVMPYGPIGRLLHSLFVRRTLERIFDYRTTKIAEILCQ